MAISLVVETGVGLPAANSYVSLVEGDAFFESHLYNTTWQGTLELRKQAALIHATRLIDAQFQFYGYKRVSTQGLQWPRGEVPDPDNQFNRLPNLAFGNGDVLPIDAVPPPVKVATMEMAGKILESNRTANPDGEGIQSIDLAGALKVVFTANDRPPVIPREVSVLLTKYGFSLSGGGSVKLRRA